MTDTNDLTYTETDDESDAEFDAKSDHYCKVSTELDLTTIWSIYEVKDLSANHPYEGATTVVYKDHWGTEPVSCSVTGSTWADLYVAADKAIRASGDYHHIYIEHFNQSQSSPAVLFLTTGS